MQQRLRLSILGMLRGGSFARVRRAVRRKTAGYGRRCTRPRLLMVPLFTTPAAANNFVQSE